MYEKIARLLIERGYNEDSAYRISEIITDYGWTDIREVLNILYED